MSTGMMGVGFFDTGHRTPRTRDWSRPDDPQGANPTRPETPEEKRKREWDESCRQETLRVQALAEEGRKKREAEQRRLQEDERKKQEAARKQQELQQRRAMFDFADEMTIQIFNHAGLDERERQAVMQTLLDIGKVHDLEYTQYLTMKIVAERK